MRERVLPVLSVVFLAAYSVIVLLGGHNRPVAVILVVVLFACWLFLIVDFCIQLVRAPHGSRASFTRTNRFSLAAAILPLLGAFVLLRELRKVPGFRGNGGNALRSRIATRVGAFAVLFIYVIGLTELALERHAPHATIVSLGDAVWWACVTIATVGYGDYAPVTVLGRVLAVVLMSGGLVIIGTASALILSYLQERVVRMRPSPPVDGDEPRPPAGSR
ncbi:MAG TPA: potassium channel family protein [Galbitalea sp.]